MMRNLLSILTVLCLTTTFAFGQITSVGIIGTATANAWDSDQDMTQDGTNADLWSAMIDLTDGEAKFRANDDWAINWGAVDFPVGVGTQDGPNIPVTAGMYNVTLNTASGDYAFNLASSTGDVLSPSAISIFPVPAQDRLSISLDTDKFYGEVNVRIVDMSGKVISESLVNLAGTVELDVDGLGNGMYMVQISNEEFVIGKRFTVAK